MRFYNLLRGMRIIRYLYLICVICFMNFLESKAKYEEGKMEVAMRKIAHDLLLQAGDSTSQIPPIQRLDDFSFLISFSNNFRLEPFQLIEVVQNSINSHHLPIPYIVQVVHCHTGEILYSYEYQINIEETPCMERAKVFECFSLQVLFPPTSKNKAQIPFFLYPMLGLILLALFWFARFPKKNKTKEIQGIAIGKFILDLSKPQLMYENQYLSLTDKEAKLLHVLSQYPNQVLSRDYLMKEVWQDDGSLLSRSLDVFISRLRKKLSEDAAIKIVNVHGEGYKLLITHN